VELSDDEATVGALTNCPPDAANVRSDAAFDVSEFAVMAPVEGTRETEVVAFIGFAPDVADTRAG